MAASNEWTEWHLSPTGWKEGDHKRDNGMQSKPPPIDRALTKRWVEKCNGYGPVNGKIEETWRSQDLQLVERLLMKFGPAPQEL